MEAKQNFEIISALVIRAQGNDEGAQNELIKITQDRLYKFCLLLSQNKEMAEDLCQEAFIKAFKNIRRIKNPKSFQGWISQIAKNLYFDMLRSPSHNETATDSLPEQATSGPEWSDILRVQSVLSHFDPEDRHLILLIELEEYSYEEAAEITGSTTEAIRSKVHRLRQKFIKIFNSNETK